LAGTIEPYSTYVVVIDKRDPEGEGQEQPVWEELQAKADTFACPVYNDNNTMYFNGNDAIVLRNISSGGNGFVIDVIGRIGQDPSGGGDSPEGWNDVPPEFTWAANGAESWTRDKSLIRKFEVAIGDVDGLDPFDPSVGWDSIPPVIINDDQILVGNWESLGSHDCTCFPLNTETNEIGKVSVYPNPVGKNEELTVSTELNLTEVSLFDITGKAVLRRNLAGVRQFGLTLSNLEDGIYIMQATDGVNRFTRKIIVH
jgi:hypothetical protein